MSEMFPSEHTFVHSLVSYRKLVLFREEKAVEIVYGELEWADFSRGQNMIWELL